MKRTVAMELILVLIILIASVLVATQLGVKASPLIVIVPDDYPTVAAAIQYSGGNTIFIKKGIYQEHSLVIDKALALIGEDAGNTIINDTDPVILSSDWPPVISATITINVPDVKIFNLTLIGAASGISGTGDRIQIVNNTVIAPYGCINLQGNNQNITQNTIQNPNKATGTYLSGYGIHIRGYNNSITANKVSGANNDAITVQGESSAYNQIYENTIYDSGISINGNCNTIAKNNITRSYISINKGSNNVIFGNRLADGKGLGLTTGNNNTFYANYVANSVVGATIGGGQTEFSYNIGGPLTQNNSVYHNNFINNTYQIWSEYIFYGTNYFDNGSEGNYWSDYNGTDSNGDGIGDAPYVIDANRSDHYPLMLPFNIDSNTITLPSPPPTLKPNPSLTPSTSTPGLTPSTSATPTNNNITLQANTYWIAAAAIAVVVALTVSAMLFVKRSKKQKPALHR